MPGIGQEIAQIDADMATPHLMGDQCRQQQEQWVRAFALLFRELPDQPGKPHIQRADPLRLLPVQQQGLGSIRAREQIVDIEGGITGSGYGRRFRSDVLREQINLVVGLSGLGAGTAHAATSATDSPSNRASSCSIRALGGLSVKAPPVLESMPRRNRYTAPPMCRS